MAVLFSLAPIGLALKSIGEKGYGIFEIVAPETAFYYGSMHHIITMSGDGLEHREYFVSSFSTVDHIAIVAPHSPLGDAKPMLIDLDGLQVGIVPKVWPPAYIGYLPAVRQRSQCRIRPYSPAVCALYH